MLFLGLLSVMLAGPVSAHVASPPPLHKHDAIYHKAQPMKVTTPTGGTSTASGQSCIGHNANASQTAMNPITGQPQAAPIVEVPVTPGGGSIPSSTTRAQQAQACAHEH